jgi:TPR repeat protein
MKKSLLILFLLVGFCFGQHYFKSAKKACDDGNLDSCISVGVYYKNGIGVRKDPFKALEYFKKTCKDANASECSLDDLTYYFGNDVNEDYFLNRFNHHNNFRNKYHFYKHNHNNGKNYKSYSNNQSK